MKNMNRDAFTLVELLVVITILGLLAAGLIVVTFAWLGESRNEKTVALIKRIENAMDADAPSRANLDTPLPVIIFYTTVMADEERPHFYNDIYGHDAALAAALQVGYPYPP